MVILNQSCVSAVARVLSHIHASTPLEPNLNCGPTMNRIVSLQLTCFQYLLYRNVLNAGNGFFGPSGPQGLFSVVPEYVGAEYEHI